MAEDLEALRVGALRRYAILDTPPEEVFDRVARLAAFHFRTPVGTVTFLDQGRQWFKSMHGLDIKETPRDVAFCHYTILQEDVMVVPDAQDDERFRENLLVTGAPHLRFYAGAPLVVEGGWKLGTVSIMDYLPRPDLDADERAFLRELANTAVRELELRLAASVAEKEMAARLALEISLREAERRLELREQRLSFVLNAAQAGFCDWDLERNQMYWSRGLRAILGVPPDSPPSIESWMSVVHPDDRASLQRQLDEHLATKAPSFRFEYRVTTPELGERWVLDFGEIVYFGGAPRRMAGIVIDITEQKRNQEALEEAKQKANEANLAKSRFLAAASHDLRQPVQSLMMFSAVLENQLTGQASQEVVGHIARSTEALKNLLDSLIDVARLEAGVITPTTADFPIGPLFDQLAAEFAAMAALKGVAFRMVRPTVWLHSDPALVERILRNLIENAVKYTPSGRILLGCRRRGKEYELMVADSGVGIPADQVEAIFQEFHQIDNPERDSRKGLGLGLSIVRRLAELLDHSIQLRSQEGRGSCFSLVIPAGTPQQETAGSDRMLAPGGLAVVVDDEEEVRLSLELQLRNWGYAVVSGTDADDVLEKLGGEIPNLVLADYRLRGMTTGVDEVRRISQRLGRRIPGALLTGDTSPGRSREARSSGLHLLHKPIHPRALHEFLVGLGHTGRQD